MYWTFELSNYLAEAPWPATKEELLAFAERTGAPFELLENLRSLPDDELVYESINDIWPDRPDISEHDHFDDDY